MGLFMNTNTMYYLSVLTVSLFIQSSQYNPGEDVAREKVKAQCNNCKTQQAKEWHNQDGEDRNKQEYPYQTKNNTVEDHSEDQKKISETEKYDSKQ